MQTTVKLMACTCTMSLWAARVCVTVACNSARLFSPVAMAYLILFGLNFFCVNIWRIKELFLSLHQKHLKHETNLKQVE